jgi:superfamily II DNA or RNA helicase
MNKTEKSKLQKTVVHSIDRPFGRLLLAPRIGKTKIGIDIIKRFKTSSILWVTPSSELATTSIPKEFILWKASKYLHKLQTVTWASLDKITGHFDLIILDEEQYITENNAKNLLSGNLSGNIITMTGTATKDNSKLEILQKLDLEVLYDISINEAVDVGLLSDYEIKVLKIPYDYKNGYLNNLLKKLKPLGSYVVENNALVNFKGIFTGSVNLTAFRSKKGEDMYFIKTELGKNLGYLSKDFSFGKIAVSNREYLLKNFEVFDSTVNMMSVFKAISTSELKTQVAKDLFTSVAGKTLLFASNITQAEYISENVYHSKTTNEKLTAFNKDEILKIAMVNSGSVGFTFHNLSNLIIVQANTDKNGTTSQKIARTLLKQKNYKATIWILCLKDTKDEDWVKASLVNFDPNKINYFELTNL